MEYTKPFKSFDEQADLLISRGMTADRSDLIMRLSTVGYYRLSGYWHIFKRSDETFWEGTSLERVWDLYAFDRQLKLLVFDGIEMVEIYFRTQLAHELAREMGPFGFNTREAFPNLDDIRYEELIKRCEVDFARSREPFAEHFREVYGDSHDLPPFWILMNTVDFGTTLTMFRGSPDGIRKKICKPFGVEPRVMDTWLLTLLTTRNICAHHGRLWNRIIGTRPMKPRRKKDSRWYEPFDVSVDRIFAVLTILSSMLEVAATDTRWRQRVLDLIEGRSQSDLAKMGFSSGWQECPLWAKWL